MKARSERSRWTTVFQVNDSDVIEVVCSQHAQLHAVLKAFEAVGRVVRAEPAKYGKTILFKARKA